MCSNVYMPLLEKPVRDRLGMSKCSRRSSWRLRPSARRIRRCRSGGEVSGENDRVGHVLLGLLSVRTGAVAKQIEALLTPAQLAALKELNFREEHIEP